MTYHEAQFHSFIIRIRKECPDDCADTPGWRGQITHMPSGAQRYVKNMAEIESFIASYLGDDGQGAGVLSHLHRWLARRHLV